MATGLNMILFLLRLVLAAPQVIVGQQGVVPFGVGQPLPPGFGQPLPPGFVNPGFAGLGPPGPPRPPGGPGAFGPKEQERLLREQARVLGQQGIIVANGAPFTPGLIPGPAII